MTQLSFRVSPVSFDADITEISVCQKMRTDRQTAFQLCMIDFSALYSRRLYIVDITTIEPARCSQGRKIQS